MSWAEVFKINKNMKRSLDEQLRDVAYREIRIITTTGTYTPEKTGIYKVICVGAGGSGGASHYSSTYGGGSGGGGGVAIKTLKLMKNTGYSVTVSTTASFVYDSNTILTASPGGYGDYNKKGTGGTASGGDNNYAGTSGDYVRSNFVAPMPGSVGVAITELSSTPYPYYYVLGDTLVEFRYGDSLLNYGGGGTGAGYYDNETYRDSYSTSGKPAAILIIPLEMEE